MDAKTRIVGRGLRQYCGPQPQPSKDSEIPLDLGPMSDSCCMPALLRLLSNAIVFVTASFLISGVRASVCIQSLIREG